MILLSLLTNWGRSWRRHCCMLCRSETLWSNLKPRDHRTGHAAPPWQPEQTRIPKISECYVTIFVFGWHRVYCYKETKISGQKYCFPLQCSQLFLHCSQDGNNTLLRNFSSSVSAFLKWCSPEHKGPSRWKEEIRKKIHCCI